MRCLVVDSDAGFSEVLREALQALGHEVAVCADGTSALRAAASTSPDLVLLDEALDNPDAVSLVRELRLLRPSLRLLLISSAGEGITWGEDLPSPQATLPKPFYVPELSERLAAAMADSPDEVTAAGAGALRSLPEDMEGEEVSLSDEALPYPLGPEGAAAPEVAGLSRRQFRIHQPEVAALMRELAVEVGAESVLLARGREVLMAIGGVDVAEVGSIADAAFSGWQASTDVSRVLGVEQVRFEQSTTGGSTMLYALGLLDALLVVIVSGTIRLGLLRHRTRSTAREIAVLCMD